MAQQLTLFEAAGRAVTGPKSGQLLKWIGNKQRVAAVIASSFPREFHTYFEPFLGSGAVLAALAPRRGVAGDSYGPLMEIWRALQEDPETLKESYASRYLRYEQGNARGVYEEIKRSFNAHPNGPDLVFLCRTCYGGVVRFRKRDGHMSTPCGAHRPIPPLAFSRRVEDWRCRTSGVTFMAADFRETMDRAGKGDFVYCDPPYSDSQSILYGAQGFDLRELFTAIAQCKRRGARVALSIDGTKKSGGRLCTVEAPEGLFARELFIDCGRSMLKRFQMNGKTLEGEVVSDRLWLTF